MPRATHNYKNNYRHAALPKAFPNTLPYARLAWRLLSNTIWLDLRLAGLVNVTHNILSNEWLARLT